MWFRRIFVSFAILLLGGVQAGAAMDPAKERAYLNQRIQGARDVIAYIDDCVAAANAGNLISFNDQWGCLPAPKAKLASWAMKQYLEKAPEGADPAIYMGNLIREVTRQSTRNIATLIGARAQMARRIADAQKRLALLGKPAPPAPQPPSACQNGAGDWSSSVPGMGSSVWHLRGSGGSLQATETGWGNAKGTAEFSGRHLRIDFAVNNVTGYYDWDLDATCSRGAGELVYTAGLPSGSHPSTISR